MLAFCSGFKSIDANACSKFVKVVGVGADVGAGVAATVVVVVVVCVSILSIRPFIASS